MQTWEATVQGEDPLDDDGAYLSEDEPSPRAEPPPLTEFGQDHLYPTCGDLYIDPDETEPDPFTPSDHLHGMR